MINHTLILNYENINTKRKSRKQDKIIEKITQSFSRILMSVRTELAKPKEGLRS